MSSSKKEGGGGSPEDVLRDLEKKNAARQEELTRLHAQLHSTNTVVTTTVEKKTQRIRALEALEQAYLSEIDLLTAAGDDSIQRVANEVPEAQALALVQSEIEQTTTELNNCLEFVGRSLRDTNGRIETHERFNRELRDINNQLRMPPDNQAGAASMSDGVCESKTEEEEGGSCASTETPPPIRAQNSDDQLRERTAQMAHANRVLEQHLGLLLGQFQGAPGAQSATREVAAAAGGAVPPPSGGMWSLPQLVQHLLELSLPAAAAAASASTAAASTSAASASPSVSGDAPPPPPPPPHGGPHTPPGYLRVDEALHWTPHVELLIRCGVVEPHPQDGRLVRMTNFYL